MAIDQWTTLLRQCLLSRTSAEGVTKLLEQRSDRHSKAIAKALFDCRQSFCIAKDPLPPRYLERFLLSRMVSVSDVLVVLVNKWNSSIRASKAVFISEADVSSLQDISLFLASKLVLDRSETARCLVLSSRWLTVLVQSLSHSTDASHSQIAEAVGSLLATLSATTAGIDTLSDKREGKKKASKTAEAVKQAVDAALGSFPALSVQLIERLGPVQKHVVMFGETQPEQSSMQAMQVQANVPETQMTASRAGTMLYLEAMLFTARTIDETIVFNFLAGRHNNDWSSMFLDIMLASFQVLERSQTGSQSSLRCPQANLFVRNKLPAILATISGSSFGVLSSEETLTSSWAQVKAALTSSELLVSGNHFLNNCSLHHLLPPDAAQRLIRDQELVSGVPKALYTKDDLISQVNASHSRLATLINELPTTDGSGPAISQATIELIMTYCQSRETHHLRDLANNFVKKPDAINALAMFVRPSNWLGPLCTLLDEWRWDDIHGESQPLYEEFGSILLFIVASKRRLNLSNSELGMQEGFMARYLDQEGVESPSLSEDSIKHLGDWVYAMYVAEGLSDEVTTSCSPQEFYTSIPNFLRQSWIAYQKGKLTLEALKGGLEYLLEPFLLPSLISAIKWTRSDSKASTVMLPIFTKNIDDEVHRTILAMLGTEPWTYKLERGGDFEKDAASYIAGGSPSLPSSLYSLVQARGADYALQCILRTLSTNFSTALDVMATLVCVMDRPLRDLLRLKFTTLKDPALAEATVHLHRRVEAYASVLIVQDLGMEFTQLPDIDTASANLDATQEQPVDDIDQVLNETAVMGNMEQPEMTGDVTMDDFYGLQGDNMGLENLDDLDLEMF